MNQHRLLFELDRVASRIRLLRFWQLLAAAWLLAAVVGLVLLVAKVVSGATAESGRAAVGGGRSLCAGIGIWLATTVGRDLRGVARRIEAAFPELRTCLLAAVEQRPNLPGGRFGYLQSNVIHQALLHAHRHEWRQVVTERPDCRGSRGPDGRAAVVRGGAAGDCVYGRFALDGREPGGWDSPVAGRRWFFRDC